MYKAAIISDCHGCYDELAELYRGIPQDGRQLISVGDLTDRGPKNVATLQFWHDKIKNEDALVVMGNHDAVLWDALVTNKAKRYPGIELTIQELNDLRANDYAEYKKLVDFWCEYWRYSRPFLKLDDGKLIVAHAGINKWYADSYMYSGKFPVLDQLAQYMCLYGGSYNKDGDSLFTSWTDEWCEDTKVIYGHLVYDEVRVTNNTWGIETGVVFGGKITCLLYPEMQVIQVEAKKKYW